MKRKDFIQSGLLAGAGLAIAPHMPSSLLSALSPAKFELPPLPYSYKALEPYIDETTMTVHHDKHFKGYTDKLNQAVEGTDFAGMSIEDILKKMNGKKSALQNNAGGYYNHQLFFASLSPTAAKMPEGALKASIDSTFGSLDEFRKQFNDAAKSVFGSGWAWLIADKHHKLKITSTPNQDNPLMAAADVKGFPLLGLDVWEHAYYLKYQNKRPDYVDAFWNVLDWKFVEKRYLSLQ